MRTERRASGLHCLVPVRLEDPLISEEHIRLLLLDPFNPEQDEGCHGEQNLRCTVFQTPLSNLLVVHGLPAFAALSYRWGSAAKTRIMVCDEAEITIHTNLYDALAASRYQDQPRLVWADALCIRQDDPDEKSSQVGLMGDIYRNAHVIIWLGESIDRETDKKVLEFILLLTSVRLQFEDYNAGVPEGRVHKVALEVASYHGCQALEDLPWLGLYEFFSNPYFKCLWIIQEVTYAWSHEIRVPTAVIEIEHLLAALQMILDLQGSAHGALFVAYASDTQQLSRLLDGHNTAANLIIRTASLFEGREPGFPDWPKGAIISRYSDHECLDRRDMIYGLVSLFNKADACGSAYPVDYRLSAAEVYTDFTLGCLRTDNTLTILSQACRQSMFSDPVAVAEDKARSWTEGLPSWCPDWAGPVHPAIERIEYDSVRETVWQASGGRMPVWSCFTHATLGLKGICVCKVTGHCSTHRFLGDDARDDLARMEDLVLSLLPLKPAKALCQAYARVMLESTKAGFVHRFRKILSFLRTDTSLPELLQEVGPLWVGLYAKRLYAEAGRALNMTGSRSRKLTLANELLFRSYLHVHRLRLFVTDNGLLGTGPQSVQVGDEVCVLYGGQIPYILRPQADRKHHTFIGEAYVYGLMNGEALDMRIPEQDFLLA